MIPEKIRKLMKKVKTNVKNEKHKNYQQRDFLSSLEIHSCIPTSLPIQT